MSIEDDDGASRALGADEHFAKPVDRERLAAWLAKAARTATANAA